jgi:DNA (cytosine-5)-methyltransferase 1
MRPRLLDLYSGAGGAARGYQMAGFHVTGVDIAPQPRYAGDAFVQADALEYVAAHGHEYDAIHASPPCQDYSRMRYVTQRDAPRLIGPTREALRATGRPYVIENVELARPALLAPLMLCGTMFGLRVRRHRLFEVEPPVFALLPPCQCRNGVRDGHLIGHRLRGPKPPGRVVPPVFSDAELRDAIGVPWMTFMDTRQAIPPAFTEYVGRLLLTYLAPPAPATGGATLTESRRLEVAPSGAAVLGNPTVRRAPEDGQQSACPRPKAPAYTRRDAAADTAAP